MLRLVWNAVLEFSDVALYHASEIAELAPVQHFLQQLCQGETSRARLCNMNRGRMRRRLRHYLSEWAPLQVKRLLKPRNGVAGCRACCPAVRSWTLHA